MSIPKRDSIVKEVKRRLIAGLGDIPLIEGNGGIWGKWDRKIPCLHFYEMPTQKNKVKPGIYQVEWPIQIEYVSRLSRVDLVYTEGRAKLQALLKAVELDERLTENFSLPNQGKDLVDSYSCVADEIMSPMPNIVDVGVVYLFKYVDIFNGYEQFRH